MIADVGDGAHHHLQARAVMRMTISKTLTAVSTTMKMIVMTKRARAIATAVPVADTRMIMMTTLKTLAAAIRRKMKATMRKVEIMAVREAEMMKTITVIPVAGMQGEEATAPVDIRAEAIMVPVDIQEDAVVPAQADIPVAAITATAGIPVAAQAPVDILVEAIMVTPAIPETQEAGIQAEWEIMGTVIADHLVPASSHAGASAAVWARAAGNHPAVTAVRQEIMEI
jgi:hypothetical protein